MPRFQQLDQNPAGETAGAAAEQVVIGGDPGGGDAEVLAGARVLPEHGGEHLGGNGILVRRLLGKGADAAAGGDALGAGSGQVGTVVTQVVALDGDVAAGGELAGASGDAASPRDHLSDRKPR